MKSIWLIGMPGCGKTTVGRLVSALSGGEFVDLDAEIERGLGMGIPEIFRVRGEAGFRDAEAAALASVCARQNLVAATGGGIVLREENVRLMRENGRIVFLDRPLGQLEKDMDWDARPLLTGGHEALARLYKARIGLYRAACDFTVPVSGTPEQTADAVYALLMSNPVKS